MALLQPKDAFVLQDWSVHLLSKDHIQVQACYDGAACIPGRTESTAVSTMVALNKLKGPTRHVGAEAAPVQAHTCQRAGHVKRAPFAACVQRKKLNK